ncbi:MAG: NAD-dependent deacylase [Candidatus Polarisedimenticolaceae bacterium]|nr:NAD-dependent deacylase [Candidatus Polarisedimenticolaceae bacterium]
MHASIPKIDPADYERIILFTGAGMSAESGVHTYRGRGGIWHEYHWEEYACEEAFINRPEAVMEFHQLRRVEVLKCEPHQGHHLMAELERRHSGVTIVTQNIDGMHQRAGSERVVELHGSLWRLRCPYHGTIEDIGPDYKAQFCTACGHRLRPDIIWFGDGLNPSVVAQTDQLIAEADLFISIGTSGVVYPAAGYPRLAHSSGAHCISINLQALTDASIYNEVVLGEAGRVLPEMFADIQ